MAFIKCSGGGKLKETVLWTNPDATKSFSESTLSLSQSFKNFDYLKIIFIYSTTNTFEFDVTYSVAGINGLEELRPGSSNVVLGWYYRNFGYDKNGNFMMSSCVIVSGSTSNTKLIPKQIIGLK